MVWLSFWKDNSGRRTDQSEVRRKESIYEASEVVRVGSVSGEEGVKFRMFLIEVFWLEVGWEKGEPDTFGRRRMMSRRSLNGMWKSGNREGCKRKIRGRKLTVLSTMIVKHLENSDGEKRRQLSQCVQTAGVKEGRPGLGIESWEPSTTECCHLGDDVDRKAGFWVTPVLSSQEKQRYNHLMMKGCELSWKMISWYRVLREGDLRLFFPLAALLSAAGSACETSGEIFRLAEKSCVM